MDILNDLQDIFKDVFDDDALIVTETASAETIDGWDSMAQIMLIAAIERQFGIKFGLAETKSFKNVGSIVSAIRSKK